VFLALVLLLSATFAIAQDVRHDDRDFTVSVDVQLVLRGTTAPRRAVHVTRVERA